MSATKSARWRRWTFILGFLAPGLVLYAVFVVSPFVQAFHYSLTDWTGISPDFEYVGLENFAQIARDPTLRRAIANNLLVLAVVPLATIILALIFAFLINVGGTNGSGVRGVRGSNFYKFAFFLPQVLAVPVIAIIWSVIAEPTPEGLLNSALGVFGIEPVGWLSQPGSALWVVMWVIIWWQVGFYLVLFNAAIAAVPREIFEAALMDGASGATTFFKITLPLLWDTIQTSWVYLAIIALDIYALVAVMTIGPGGPDNATQVLSLQIAQNGFEYGRAGYASAIGVVLFGLTLVIAMVMLRATRRERIEF